MNNTQMDIKGKLLDLDSLPPLSMTAARLLEVLGDPDLSVQELAEIIETDPAMSARIIGLANAAFFAQVRPIYSVQEAMLRVLGMRAVRSLALSLALAKGFDFSHCPEFDVGNYWSTALISATLARNVALDMVREDIDSDEVYLCGLLHGIGELALVHLQPEKMKLVYQELSKAPDADYIQLERDILGVDHWYAGEWVAVRWNLPESVVHSISYLRESHSNAHNADLVEIVRACRNWTIARINHQPDALHVGGVETALLEKTVTNLEEKFEELMSLAGGMA